jgi:hypothetical protein
MICYYLSGKRLLAIIKARLKNDKKATPAENRSMLRFKVVKPFL